MKILSPTSASRFLLGLAAVAAMTACSASTSHLTDITTSADKSMSPASSAFAKTDTIYAQGGVANVASKVTITWHVIAEKAEGVAPNTPIPAFDKTLDIPSDASPTLTMSPPTAGWPAGTYKIELDMSIDGVQKDQKTAEFTIGS
jgi:hypothetical protein